MFCDHSLTIVDVHTGGKMSGMHSTLIPFLPFSPDQKRVIWWQFVRAVVTKGELEKGGIHLELADFGDACDMFCATLDVDVSALADAAFTAWNRRYPPLTCVPSCSELASAPQRVQFAFLAHLRNILSEKAMGQTLKVTNTSLSKQAELEMHAICDSVGSTHTRRLHVSDGVVQQSLAKVEEVAAERIEGMRVCAVAVHNTLQRVLSTRNEQLDELLVQIQTALNLSCTKDVALADAYVQACANACKAVLE